ncbi:MAG: LytTR family DNA-binding domain-containing protein [Bacteroidales bacterium]|nr:LytTR family DNA-binding domain-containing protein [Bacteroidales bacterium]
MEKLTNPITCMVVDDDEVDRLTALYFLSNFPFFKVIGVYDSPVKALEAAADNLPDVLFLDVNMPEMSGLELRKQLLHIPACVFITSFADYALESFELEALDYLVKPFTADRFTKTAERLKDYMDLRHKSKLLAHSIGAETVFIKEGHTQVKLQLHEIIYLEALKDYTRIITSGKKHIVLSPLGSLIKENAFRHFIRIHRSYAVQKNYIKKIASGGIVLDNNVVLPVGRAYKEYLTGITT